MLSYGLAFLIPYTIFPNHGLDYEDVPLDDHAIHQNITTRFHAQAKSAFFTFHIYSTNVIILQQNSGIGM
jgi:hypothetical protein